MSLDSDLHKKFSKEECRNNVIQLFGGFTSFDNFSKSLDQSINEIPELSVSSDNLQLGGGNSSDVSIYNIQNGGFDSDDDDDDDDGQYGGTMDSDCDCSDDGQSGGGDPYYKKYQKYKSKYLEFKKRLNL